MGQQTAITFPAPAQATLEDRLLTREDVCKMTTMSRSKLYAEIKDGRFPKQVQLGPMSVAWRLSDVQRWIRDLPAVDAEASEPPLEPPPEPLQPAPKGKGAGKGKKVQH